MFRPATILTTATIQPICAAGLAAIKAGQSTIDLSDVNTVDSSAVAALIAWRRAALQQGKVLSFTNLPANLHSLAALYGVADLLRH
ncbi:MAG: STAS domain-containing protein [Proteobacteria bacterium]|nr:STAS domain-containing protein [Pseudomonadota bacterium]